MTETAASAAVFDERGRALLVLERDEWSYPGELPSPGVARPRDAHRGQARICEKRITVTVSSFVT